jgi:hypothetical protein
LRPRDQLLAFFHPNHSGFPSWSLNRKTVFPRFTLAAIINMNTAFSRSDGIANDCNPGNPLIGGDHDMLTASFID